MACWIKRLTTESTEAAEMRRKKIGIKKPGETVVHDLSSFFFLPSSFSCLCDLCGESFFVERQGTSLNGKIKEVSSSPT